MSNRFFLFHYWGPCIIAALLFVGGCKKKELPTPAPAPKTPEQKTDVPKVPESIPSDVVFIKGNDHFIEFLKNNPKAIVDFTATWCGPCQMIAPELEKIALRNKDKGLKVAKVDIDRNPDIASAYKVQPIPDIRFFLNGKEIAKVIGVDIGGLYIGTQDLLNRKLENEGKPEAPKAPAVSPKAPLEIPKPEALKKG
ncbi:MAG: thioredoxin domain-containing protein [Planctomycetia bacterium]|nr:thioredoxin domain-containing protein [Planctomycetia bacterium]